MTRRLPVSILGALFFHSLVTADPAAAGWEGVRVRPEPARESFMRGEPITLTVHLQNTGGASADFPTSDLDVPFQTVSVEVTEPGGKPTEYRTWYVSDPARPGFQLAPGEERTFLLTLHWNAKTDKYAFDAAGAHEVRVRIVNLAGGPAPEGTATVRIAAPANDSEKDQQNLMLDRRVAGVLAGVREPEPELVQRLESAARQNTRFAPYLDEALGRFYGREHLQRKPDLERSERFLRRSLDKGGAAYPRRTEVLSELTFQALSQGEPVEAEGFVRDAEQLSTKSVEVFEMRNAVERFEKFDANR